jgi:transglutaminase-like putative cysteine protease
VEKATAPLPHRRPPALLPPSTARLGGFAALALLGALQWQRMVVDLSARHAVLWVLVAVAAAVGVLWADRLTRLRATATLAVAAAGLLGAYAVSGLSLALLKPRRLDELAAGLSHGTEALASVKMPYEGADPWPSLTLQLLGALLCVLAALLAFWPREGGRGYQFLALALLLVMVAAPVVSIGGTEPVLLGFALTALTVCFLWLERLPLRPGLGIAAMLALALAGALPLAGAADREDPWFDYKAFAEGLGPDEPLNFDWGHSYGPITWPRDGAEVLRVDARRPSYWKVADLDDFDGRTWIDTGIDDAGSAEPELDLAADWTDRPSWRETLRVTLRRLETTSVVGAGTTLGVEDTARDVRPSGEAGLWRSETRFRAGDSYTVKSYVPRPTPGQLADSTSGFDARPGVDLDLGIPTEAQGGVLPDGPGSESDAAGGAGDDRDLRRLRQRADIRFPPFTPNGRGPVPFARYQTLVRSNDGDLALRRSPYAETWRLAKRLMRQSSTPYDYVVAVDRYLQDGFTYSEKPEPVSPGRATLDGFLFETKSGYCQHFSGAMAILLRMGGIPARVATGFSPGGYSERKGAWIVRDTDAHSWVEVWFDDYGWVAFDPTPAATPARSQIAALDRPPETSGDEGGDTEDAGGSAARTGGVRPDLLGQQEGSGGAATSASEDAAPPWWWFALAGIAVLLLALWGVVRWRRRTLGPAAALDRAVAELEAALRRIGRPVAGTTLQQLEQHLGRSPEAAAYLRALRAGRYAPRAAAPTARGRRALRRELGSGDGPRGRLRALWALPPWR